jgi:uncharacterized Fe-S cluster protein YjdI
MSEERKIVKQYTNGEITVVWKPDLCTHVAYCFTELPEVFDPSERPWINAKGASTEKIIKQVNRCPTGALSYFYNDAEKNEKLLGKTDKDIVKVEITKNGPVVIKGKTLLVDNDGKERIFEKTLSLCRCGKSKNKPLCDDSHLTNKFE